MLHSSRGWLSNTLHNSTPFVEGALQLIKLQLAHRNASVDKNKPACIAIEQEFLREVEAFRPCFTMAASLEVARQYSKQVCGALHYFGLSDDPLTRQLDLVMGRESMREMSGRGAGMFKGVQRPGRGSAGSSTSAFGVEACGKNEFDSLLEVEETTLPSELPNPPKVDLLARRRPGAVKIPLKHRGHWVLQEAEIAITKNERREDPW